MEHSEQVSVVKQALELEKNIYFCTGQLNSLNSACFRESPSEPVKQIARKENVEIKAKVKVNWLLLLLPIGILLLLSAVTKSAFVTTLAVLSPTVWPLVYYFAIHRKKKSAEKVRIANSEEYRNQCEKAEAKYAREQAEYDEQYNRAMAEYNNVTMPKYNEEKGKWLNEHNRKVAEAEGQLTKFRGELTKLYADKPIVPKQYRQIEALEYIYDMISTSDYDVKQAIESYDKSKQRELDMERLMETKLQNELAMEQNELLGRQNEIAEKTRKDQNRAAIVTAVQRHNLNKIIKGK